MIKITIIRVLNMQTFCINTEDRNGRTQLDDACDKGNTDLVKRLLENKDIDVNLVSEGHPPLVIACVNDRLDIVNTLISRK